MHCHPEGMQYHQGMFYEMEPLANEGRADTMIFFAYRQLITGKQASALAVWHSNLPLTYLLGNAISLLVLMTKYS